MNARVAADDPLTAFDAAARQAFSAVAEVLIPAAHGMPSAGEVINDTRLRFVLNARPDLVEPLAACLRPQLGDEPQARLAALAAEPDNLAALHLVVVGGYYTDKGVRELIGYPGQEAIEVKSWLYPEYLEEGLIDKVLAHGPVWRDPATGVRARATGIPQTYAQREWSDEHPTPAAQGGNHGHDGS